MAKQKEIAQKYSDWEESYNKVAKLLQALQICCPRIICDLRTIPYYDGNLMIHDYDQFDKVFWTFSPCVEAFKHCKPFIFVDGMHLYGKYSSVLLITVAQDSNSNIILVVFVIVESKTMES
ncbi:uncharacterized protein [Arachis hypogaea]|uniref:uncharacterized protein n=1 Tax=Arachis hypogaea TaxID=3818 RepID=UPI000DEC3EF6|nr:uncharacterized protein LOC112730547 [Arachis hypogaea]